MDVSDTDIKETAGNNWPVSRSPKINCEGINKLNVQNTQEEMKCINL